MNGRSPLESGLPRGSPRCEAGSPRCEAGKAGGFWPWFWQRATAVGLAFILTVHIWVLHFAKLGELIIFAGVTVRLKTLTFITVDSLLLALALFHGLNGARMVILDFGPPPRIQFVIDWLLTFIGALTFFYGMYALLPFIARL